MPATPLIRTPANSGGTFYAFSSASRDLTKSFNNENIKMEFSKFVAINIPINKSLDEITFDHYENYVQFDTIDGAIINGVSADPNINLSESLQNYALNLESLILSDENYDPTIKRSIAERVFFKWLKEMGALRFRVATDTEKSARVSDELRFVEEDNAETGAVRYSTVVKYIGDVDMTNSVEKSGEAYTQIYIHLPTNTGSTPTVLFDAISDDNYKPDLVITGTDEYIYGRNISTIQPDGLSINAFYDYDTSVSYSDPDANWHSPIVIQNSYYTERTTFEDATNIDIQKTLSDFPSSTNFDGVAYRRSKLDGISLDFEPSNYYDIANNSAISTIQQYNSSGKSNNYEYNAILLYYDLYDTADPSTRVSNLYGVLFIDNMTASTDRNYIATYQKYKPNEITKLNGNSYGLTINLKFNASITNGGVDNIINEYNTFSLSLFTDAVVQLQEASKLMLDQQSDMLTLTEDVTELKSLMYSIDDVSVLESKITELETDFSNAQITFASNSSILDLVASNSDSINSILNGQVDISLQYNTNVLQSGSGITLNKSVPNRVIVENKVQGYNLDVVTDIDGNVITSTSRYDLNVPSPAVYFSLRDHSNMCRVYHKNIPLNDLKIYINETDIGFSEGQTIRIVFPNILNLDEYDVEIYTDSENSLGYGQYGKLIAKLTKLDLLSTTPIIELTCENASTYSFYMDVLR